MAGPTTTQGALNAQGGYPASSQRIGKPQKDWSKKQSEADLSLRRTLTRSARSQIGPVPPIRSPSSSSSSRHSDIPAQSKTRFIHNNHKSHTTAGRVARPCGANCSDRHWEWHRRLGKNRSRQLRQCWNMCPYCNHNWRSKINPKEWTSRFNKASTLAVRSNYFEGTRWKCRVQLNC